MNSILITDSGVNTTSGGGLVSLNLMEALQYCTSLKYIFSSQRFPENKYNNIPAYTINPQHYGYKETSPFFLDYMAFHLLPKATSVDLVQTYGCPHGLVVEELKREFHAKIVCDLAPHNISVSQEEHMKHVGKYPYPHLTDTMLWGLYSRHLRLADQVIVHSHSSAEYIKKKARLKNDPIVIPHGCYLPETTPALPDSFVPGYFGSVGLDKGIIYMVTAWLNCPTITAPYDTPLLLGGREAQTFRLNDKQAAHFKIMGFIPDLVDFYKLVNVYIQPSVVEGFGITPLEAMSYGRPVIVAEGAGMSELVTDGQDGFVVPIRNPVAIRDKLVYLHDNPSEIRRMGAEARKTASKYSWNTIKQKYISVYQELLR